MSDDERARAITRDALPPRGEEDEEDAVDDDVVDDDPHFAALLSDIARTPTMHVGTRLGRYRIDGVLGAGGMGVVYAAHDDTLTRDVALKVLNVSDPERVLHEARASAALHHEGVCAVFDTGVVDDTPYIALERIDGDTLRALLPLDDAGRARAIAQDIARALAHAHARGVAHGDLKPENVMITREGRAKLLDLGIARRGESDDVAFGGTAGYLPPDDPKGSGARPLSNDTYAFGVVVGELFTGTRGTALAGMPRAWRALTAACLSPRPEERPRDGAALVALLHAIEARRARARALGFSLAGLALVLALASVVPAIVRAVVGGGSVVDIVDVGLDLAGEARFRAGVSALLAGDREGARAALDEVIARGSTHPYPTLLLFLTDPVGEHAAKDAARVRALPPGRGDADDVLRFVRAVRAPEEGAAAPPLDENAVRALLARLPHDLLGRLLVATSIAPRAKDDEQAARRAVALREDLLTALARDAPDVPLVALARAWTAQKIGDGARARVLLDDAAARAPGNVFIAMERAESMVSQDPARARDLLDEVIAKRPSDVFPRFMRAEASALSGDLDGARDEVFTLVDGPFAQAARARGALVFSLLFSSRARLHDARALMERGVALAEGGVPAREVHAVLARLAEDARALGDDETAARAEALARERPVPTDALVVRDPDHKALRALLTMTRGATRRDRARVLVDTHATCAATTLFFSLGCRTALARAALVFVDEGGAKDDRAVSAVAALFPPDARAPTLDALRARLAATP